MSNGNNVDVLVTIERETDAAILVNDGDRTAWLPKSKVAIDEVEADGTVVIHVPEWLALNEELI